MEKQKSVLPVLLAVLLVTGMTAAAELTENREILFPEIAAIAAGALIAPKLSWQTDAPHLFGSICIGAAAGILIVRFVPLPLWMQLCLAFLLASGLFLVSRTGFAPMISAIVLPVMIQSESVVYPVAAAILTLLILAARRLTEAFGIRAHEAFTPLPAPDRKAALDLFVRWGIGCGILILAVLTGFRFAAAPPLLVAYTEFWKPTSPAQKHPIRMVLFITVCALIGAGLRMGAGLLGMPLFPAAGLTMLAVCLLMLHTKLFVPPAAALSVLAYLIPENAVTAYPVMILAGASALTAAAVLHGKVICRKGEA